MAEKNEEITQCVQDVIASTFSTSLLSFPGQLYLLTLPLLSLQTRGLLKLGCFGGTPLLRVLQGFLFLSNVVSPPHLHPSFQCHHLIYSPVNSVGSLSFYSIVLPSSSNDSPDSQFLFLAYH